METLYCRKCQIELNKNNAEPNYGIYKQKSSTPFQRICKKCLRKQRADRKYRIVLEYKKQGCSQCGYNKNIAALEFHHAHGQKDTTISHAIWKNNSIKKMRQELEKCILLCSNCHRELHNPHLNLDF